MNERRLIQKGTGHTWWHSVCVCVCVCARMHAHTHLVTLLWIIVAPTVHDPMDCSPELPCPCVEVSQVKMLGRVAFHFSRGSNLDIWHCRFLPSELQYSTVRCKDVILVTVYSYLKKVAGGTGMGLMISDHEQKSLYPLFISFSRVDVHYNWH